MEINNEEILLPRKKSEEVISHSYNAGNFGLKESQQDPGKDIFMTSLDSIADYVKYLPFLPKGFGITGGVARGALLELLGEKSPRAIDIDVEGIIDLNPDFDKRHELEESFLQNGKVEKVGFKGSLIEYFHSRDFTINEVFLYGNKLYFSRRAIQDMEEKVIRPTKYETDNYEDDTEITTVNWESVKPKLLIKALLLEIEFIKQYGKGSIKDAEIWKWKLNNIPAFYLALGLDKASKKEIELEFLRQLLDLRAIPADQLPEGVTMSSVRRLAGLTKHWMIEEHNNRNFVFSDEFFDRAYSEEMKVEDDTEFEEIYNKLISKAVKLKNVSKEDLEYF